MPFGLSNSPSAYCRLVQLALSKLPPGFAIAYLDDILIYSNTIVDHMCHLEAVLRIHAEVGMKINLSKTKIFRDQVTYLGHLVSHQGVEMIPDYISKIQLWPLTGISLNRFTGFAQAESRVSWEKSNDSNYPSPLDLLNLCGLPLPAHNQAEEIRRLMEKMDHLITVQTVP